MHAVTAPCVVSLSWRLYDGQNQLIGELDEPAEFFCGGEDLMPGVEAALQGRSPGWTDRLVLEPDQAFGDYDPALVCFESRNLFPPEVEAGMSFDGLPPGAATPGMPADALYRVTEIYPEHVVLDGNHPLAGMQLRIEIVLHAVRAVSAGELAAGSVGDSPIVVVPPLH